MNVEAKTPAPAKELSELSVAAAKKNILKKLVFSKPSDKTIIKMVITPKAIGGKGVLQAEYFHKDNKVTHKNIVIDEKTSDALFELSEAFSQINLICNGCECEYRRSSSGKQVLIGAPKASRSIAG